MNEPVIERSMQDANALGAFPTPATQWTFLDVPGHPWMVGRAATTIEPVDLNNTVRDVIALSASVIGAPGM